MPLCSSPVSIYDYLSFMPQNMTVLFKIKGFDLLVMLLE